MLPVEPYRVIVADPPWKFGDKLPGPSRGAERNYGVMTVEDVKWFLTDEGIAVADNAWLFLWRVASMQEEALSVVRAWGFTVKSEIVWNKVTKDGGPRIGMGRYVRNAHEVCLVCTRGKVAPHDRGVPSWFTAPRGEHSAKPDEFWDIVHRLVDTDDPRTELFARKHRAGWDAVGHQLPHLPADKDHIPAFARAT